MTEAGVSMAQEPEKQDAQDAVRVFLRLRPVKSASHVLASEQADTATIAVARPTLDGCGQFSLPSLPFHKESCCQNSS